VFTPDNKTALAIAREHLIAPITCDTSRGERARVLELFRAGALRAIASSQVLNEGVDVPDADVAIVVGGRLGEREHIQRIGRVLRPLAGKSATIYELVVQGSSEVRAGVRRRKTAVTQSGFDGWAR
jgi:superfamily II DNA or RNA helicase